MAVTASSGKYQVRRSRGRYKTIREYSRGRIQVTGWACSGEIASQSGTNVGVEPRSVHKHRIFAIRKASGRSLSSPSSTRRKRRSREDDSDEWKRNSKASPKALPV
jgi:hypothetical protein